MTRARGGLLSRRSAGTLAGKAGQALARASVERLETRQMLFSLTITEDLIDPFTGVGQITGYFGYTLPLFAELDDITFEDPEVVDEDFEDEDEAGGAGLGPIVTLGEQMNGSGLFIQHNVAQPTANMALVGFLAPGGNTVEDIELRVRLQEGEFFLFRFRDPAFPQLDRAVESVTMSIGNGFTAGGGDFPVNNVSVQFLYAGEVLQESGAGLFFGTNTSGFITFQTNNGELFDEIRFVANTGLTNPQFFIDDVSFVLPDAPFQDSITGRIFGVEMTFSGPLGASVQVLDLYGRDMVQTIALGIPENATVALVDRNNDGVPDFNDGIGRFNFINTDENTSLTLSGGTIESITDVDPEHDFVQFIGGGPGFAFSRIEGFTSLFDTFEESGFFLWFEENQTDPQPIGLPAASGSVIIGSPFVRSLNQYNPGAPVFAGGPQGIFAHEFNRTDQGFFTVGGASMGSIIAHAAVFGNSTIQGSLDRFNVGVMFGSLVVGGDLGSYVVAGDAGVWAPEADPLGAILPQDRYKTGSQLVVERTLGQAIVGGRSLVDITVKGDLSSPSQAQPRDSFRYFELEAPYAIVRTAEAEAVVADMHFLTDGLARDRVLSANGLPGTRFAQQALFDNDVFRNDALLSAEWVGGIGSSVQIFGDLGFGDPVNSADDRVDVFGFAARKDVPVVLQLQTTNAAYIRVVDAQGRTVAAVSSADLEGGAFAAGAGLTARVQFSFSPSESGAYYLVVADTNAAADSPTTGFFYVATITGLAPTTFGSYRSATSIGAPAIARFDPASLPALVLQRESSTLSLLSGSMGSIRAGTGLVNADGSEVAGSETINRLEAGSDEEEDDDLQLLYAGSFSIPGTLYQIVAGGDIGQPTNGAITLAQRNLEFTIGGDLGQLYTGASPTLDPSPEQGDLSSIGLTVGGSIGRIDVSGSVSIDQDTDPDTINDTPFNVRIETGKSGGKGDIGVFRVGSHMAAGTVAIITSPGSTIGAFLVSQDIEFGNNDPNIGITTINPVIPFSVQTQLGAGSDIKFASFPSIDIPGSFNNFIPIVGATPVTITDDGGAKITITVAGAPTGVEVGRVRVLPVDGSQGVVIGEIEVDLSLGTAGGTTLNIAATGPIGQGATVGIGRIHVLGAGVSSSVRLSGSGQIDVLEIRSEAALNEITNLTPGGDIVSVDVPGLNVIDVVGSIGRTELPAVGPQRLGRRLTVEDVGLPAELMSGDWNGQIFRPVTDTTFDAGNAYLDDAGSPVDLTLNGLLVRAGNVTRVEADGAIGNVILTAGDLLTLVANANKDTGPAFDGVVGTVFATNVISADIGDGLAPSRQSPIVQTSIVARDDVHRVFSGSGGSIRSLIAAGNALVGDRAAAQDGIDLVELTAGGSIVDATIITELLDGFWNAYHVPETFATPGNVNIVRVVNGDIFRSAIRTGNLNEVRVTGGDWDASLLNATGDVNRVVANNFRNSTSLGTTLELRQSLINIGRNLQTLSTSTPTTGTIADLTLNVVGNLTGAITSQFVERSQLNVAGTIQALTVADSFRGSGISTGGLESMTVADAIRSSAILVSGRLFTLTAREITGTSIAVTGPDGEIGTITTAANLEADIASTGPVGTISSTTGDIIGKLTTTTDRGNIAALSAARDLRIQSDVSGNIATMTAGRHIGDPATGGVVLVRGNLTSVSLPNGQLYTDLRVGGSILGPITIGSVSNLPGDNLLGSGSIIAFGSISNVSINGDFAGDIVSNASGIGSVTIVDGSLLPQASIVARNGSISTVRIVNGHLLGDIHADETIFLVDVVADGSGVFGDIGVNPNLSAGRAATATRNQLPPGIAPTVLADGPRITAGHNIGQILALGGSMFEAFIHAGRHLATVDVGFNILNDSLTTGVGTVIAAGDRVNLVRVGSNAANLFVGGGIIDFGDDQALGGTGTGADSVKAGRVQQVTIGLNATDVTLSAGIVAGADGVYNTTDDEHALGLSYVQNVDIGGTVTAVSAHADSGLTNATAGVQIGGRSTPVVGRVLENLLGGFASLGTEITSGGSLALPVSGGVVPEIRFSGPGRAFYDAGTNRLTLWNTSLASSIQILPAGTPAIPPGGAVPPPAFTLSDFNIVSNDDAMLGTLIVAGTLAGNSNVIIDGFLRTINVGSWQSTGRVVSGNDITTATFGQFSGGSLEAIRIGTLAVAGDMGGNATFYGSAGITVGGNLTGRISMDRSLTGALAVTGDISRGGFRTAGSVGSITARSIRESFISAFDNIGPVTVTGSVFDSSIVVGGDIGRDVNFGGTGLNADRVSSGSIGPVTIGGDFVQSDIVAGGLRGADGFFGTSDDLVADGRSTIGTVTIAGSQVGSPLGTESYRISSTGTIGAVTIGGAPVVGPIGNFAVTVPQTDPLPIQVTDLRVVEDSRIYRARIAFNQPIDASTLPLALSVSQIRDNDGQVLLRLSENVDYTVEYDASTATAIVTFSRDLTDRGLPITAGVPHAGIYRFELDANVLRASLVGARLDGDGNGFAQQGDNFSYDDLVGDGGDKLAPGQVPLNNSQGQFVKNADLYGPVNLNLLLDNNRTPDGLPDANEVFRVSGSIGDHPDNDAQLFGFSSDVDVYELTLQAGQILRIGAIEGAALLASRALYNAAGQQVGGTGSDAQLLSSELDAEGRLVEFNYLVKTTGLYRLAVSATALNNTDFLQQNTLSNLPPQPQGVGSYSFDVSVFDDGDSGFSADTDSGDGQPLPQPPLPPAFAGPDAIFGTSDDIQVISLDGFDFRLNIGVDGQAGTGDDSVNANRGSISITRAADGVTTSLIESAIGPAGSRGVGGFIRPDVDVYHVASRQPIAPGTLMRVTVRLAESGSDLGSRRDVRDGNLPGEVQLAVFETTNSQQADDGVLVLSPTSFAPNAQTPGTIADDGQTSYGYDSNGDFFMQFRTPGALNSADPNNPSPASYAVYIQGAYNADYQLEVITGDAAPLVRKTQNFLLELNGGTIDWLEAGGVTTTLAPFSASVLGFAGQIGGQSASNYIVSNFVQHLQAVFAARGYDVEFSTTPAAFEFEDFSTIFISSAPDPIAFFNEGVFGYSERSDAFNADRNDQAVIFVPPLATLGLTPSNADADRLVDALTAASTRRMGELLGLRTAAPSQGGASIDPMASNSVNAVQLGFDTFRYSTLPSRLSPQFDSLDDTDFYLGRIQSASLLDAILAKQ